MSSVRGVRKPSVIDILLDGCFSPVIVFLVCKGDSRGLNNLHMVTLNVAVCCNASRWAAMYTGCALVVMAQRCVNN